jgi:hypothetical protein
MDTRFQIITDLVSKGDVVLNKILKTIEPTDVMTQAIDGEDFHACYDLLNIVRRTTQLQVTPLSILYAGRKNSRETSQLWEKLLCR